MFTIGIDAHKQLLVGHAVDDDGREAGNWHGPNIPTGWSDCAAWIGQCAPGEVLVGIEGAYSYGRGLSQSLVAVGLTVYEINPRWTARQRQFARRQHKTDRLDARAVALIVRQDAPDLPLVQRDDDGALLQLLVRQRDDAMVEATRLSNQLHALLFLLDPSYLRRLGSLRSRAGITRLLAYEASATDPLSHARALGVRRLAQRLELALSQATTLKDEIESLAREHFAPLTTIVGIAPLTAGMLAAILGPGQRFRSERQLAAYAGAAPIEASSAGHVHHRLNRGGNRQLNAILYRIALTQYRLATPGRDYVRRALASGRTLRDAIRSLKRFIVRAIFKQWTTLHQPAAPCASAACT